MKTYYAYIRPQAQPNLHTSLSGMKITRDDFHWLALVFGSLWALIKGSWFVALGFLAINIFFDGMLAFFGVSQLWLGLVTFMLHLSFAFFGASLIMTYWRLTGWQSLGAFTGTKDEAERYFVTNLITRWPQEPNQNAQANEELYQPQALS